MRARRAGALGDRPRRPGRRRRRGDPRQQGDRGRPGVAARTRPRRRHHRARRHGQARAGHLRRLPDAVPPHRRPGGVQVRAASRASVCSTPTSSFAPDKTLRHWDSPAARLRDPPRPTGAAHRGRLARSSGSGAAACTARTGTVCSTTTTSAASGWPTRRGRGDGFVVADDVDVSARRDAQLDLMADLLARAHRHGRRHSRCWKTAHRNGRRSLPVPQAEKSVYGRARSAATATSRSRRGQATSDRYR